MIPTPPTLEDHELPDLLVRLRAGDVAAAHALVLGFTLNAKRIAGNLQKRTKSNYDILEAEALYFVCVAVNKAKDNPDVVNIAGWVTSYVNFNLLQYCYTNHLIKTTRQKFKALNLTWKPLMSSLNMGDTLEDDQNSCLVDTKEVDRQELRELLDVIESVIENDKERQVLVLRLKGFTDEEIGKTMKIDSRRVGDIRRNLQAKFRKAMP